MQIIDYFKSENQAHWLERIAESEWSAGELLTGWLRAGTFREHIGERSTVLLLTEGDALLSYCTYAQRDDIPTDITPWMGFVYTYPPYRGRRLAGVLMAEAERRAKEDGFKWLHISTGHVGLYEKYGCAFWRGMKDVNGEPVRVYRKKLTD